MSNSGKAQYFLPFLSLVFICTTLLTSCADKDDKKDPSVESEESSVQVFEKISPEASHLNFENNITENLSTLENLFNFDYFYNGAGVGVEDLNNDGLLDVVFCGNQVDNRVFLNKGNLVFEDITANSGINTGKQWSNGITFADINSDGWKDIYISQGGPNQRLQRKNLLFLNQKDGTFKEVAEQYGLADMGITTQSVFFDMDLDGDLDCLVMNENEYYGVDPINLYRLIEDNSEAQYFNSSHLYRNDGGTFVDITREAGIERPIFGLGLMVSDINNDGYPDIYIASDYYIPDALFINLGDGTFTDKVKEYTNQISYYGMGLDIADINNDGLQDIFVLDMASSDHVRSKTLMASMDVNRFNYLVKTAGFHHQYMFNTLQLNQGNDRYSNIAHLTEMGNTDWSWSVLMADFDLNTTKDIHITNGYRRYALDNDVQQQVFEARRRYGNNVPMEIKRALYEAMPSEKLPNILYQNDGDLKFSNKAEAWGLGDYSFSNGAAMGDLDNDGDLDLIVNNMDENAFLYKNTSVEKQLGNFLKVSVEAENSEPLAKVSIHYDGEQQLIETNRVRGYMSAHENTAHFGLGKYEKVDTLRIEWPDGKYVERYDVKANSTLNIPLSDARPAVASQPKPGLFSQLDANSLGIDFTHKENPYDDFEKEILLPFRQSNLGPGSATADVNGDGAEDLYIGGASGQPGVLYVQDRGKFRKHSVSTFEKDAGYEDIEALFFDYDGDDDKDLIVVSGGNEFSQYSSYYADRLYLNDGKGNFTRKNVPAFEHYPESGGSVAALDFDNDGDQDIVVGNRIVPQNYPLHAPSRLYENVEGELLEVTTEKASELLDFGIVNDVIASDYNGDGWTDIIAIGEWSPIGIFRNENGSFRKIVDPSGTLDTSGWWFSITEMDVNQDGKQDYLLGNAGLNIKFKASASKPFKVYATDFDDSGSMDIVLSKKYGKEYVPVRGRECSSQQMPFIKEKFPSYKEFANASLQEVYGEKLDQSYAREVTEFHSVILVNKGNDTFEIQHLPIEAQLFPVFTVARYDINKDGVNDLILGGNIYETEVETPRLDAISGLILISDGNGGFKVMDHSSTGLYLDTDLRRIHMLTLGDKPVLVGIGNSDKPMVFGL